MKSSSSLVRVMLIVASLPLVGQTRVDLGSQTKGDLPELQVARTNNVVLTIGAACSIDKPCVARLGGTSINYNSGATVTLSAGTPTIRIYVSDGSDGSPAGTLKVRNSAASGVVCSSECTVENSASSFPGMSIPVAVWSASVAGQWDTVGADWRAFLSSQAAPIAGVGIVVTPGVVAVDTSLIPKKFSGSGAPGIVSGSVRGDLYADTLNGDSYQCFSITACSAVAAGNWVKLSTGPQPYLTGPWFFYGRSSSVSEQNPSLGQGTSNGMVLMGRIDTPARQIHEIAISVTTPAVSNCGSGSQACGLVIAILDATRTTVACRTVTATGGNSLSRLNLHTSGPKRLAFASGTQVSDGTCTLPYGNYWWAMGTDSVELRTAADSAANAGALLGFVSPDAMLSYGTVVTALTGNGATLGFVNLGGTLSPASANLPILAGIF